MGAVLRDNFYKVTKARPLLKWAGGKSQLLDAIALLLPVELKKGKIQRYVEPFFGGGAVFFYVAQNFHIDEFYVSDINPELIILYKTVQKNVNKLIEELKRIEAEFHSLDKVSQKEYFYSVRSDFNRSLLAFDFFHPNNDWIARSAQMIFLNRTCFNGLFRVNSKGEFNVPFGDYENPKICDSENLLAVAELFEKTQIQLGGYQDCEVHVNANTFVYFDPPYRPLNKTASFNAYHKDVFDDEEQKKLSSFYRRLDNLGAKLMLSNSDPKNENADDNFFDDLYMGYSINRVTASRMINSKASKRGQINELIITNY